MVVLKWSMVSRTGGSPRRRIRSERSVLCVDRLRRGPFLALMVTLLIVAAGPVAAQNITNGDFEVDLAGWWASNPPHHDWSSEDHENEPTSGSLVAYKDWPAGAFHQARQSVQVEADDVVGVEAWAFMPAASNPVDIYLGFEFYSDSGCVDYLDHDREYGPVTPDEWTRLTHSATAPSGTQCAVVGLGIWEPPGGTLPVSAHFDGVRLFLFEDGFERGNTEEWSAVVP